jgi:hypothetical protein
MSKPKKLMEEQIKNLGFKIIEFDDVKEQLVLIVLTTRRVCDGNGIKYV